MRLCMIKIQSSYILLKYLYMCMSSCTFAFNINQLVLCVAMLLAKNQRSQAAQAMHELGNLQYHASNIR